MRYVFLIRHCEPVLPDRDKKYCLGCNSNPPLSEDGKIQMSKLGEALKGTEFSNVFCSPLDRAVQTAMALTDKPDIVYGFRELDMGIFDGLSFDEIREKYPDEYAARGENPDTYAVSEGESAVVCMIRSLGALKHVLDNTDGNIAIVAHAGVNRLILTHLMGLKSYSYFDFPQRYSCINILAYNGNELRVIGYDILPGETPDGAFINELYNLLSVPDDVRAHCDAVQNKALELFKIALKSGVELSREKIVSASMLHDIFRSMPNHEKEAEEYLKTLGFSNISGIVGMHNGGFNYEGIDEAKILFLADKYIYGTEEVTIPKRYEASLKKCNTDIAKKKHSKRLEEALRIEREFKELVK